MRWKILLEIDIAKGKGLSVTKATSERGKWKQSMAWGWDGESETDVTPELGQPQWGVRGQIMFHPNSYA